MSIFGKLDAKEIPASPYFIEAGTYSAEVTKAEFRISKKDEKRQLFVEYTIDDEDSIYNERRAGVFFNLVDPDLTEEEYKSLPAEEQKNISRDLSFLKRALTGYGNVKGLGENIDDLNDPNWDPAGLVGRKVTISVTNYGAENQGVNVRWANLREE